MLQFSYEDQNTNTLEQLHRLQRSSENPLVKLRCGVKILAHLVAKDEVIADLPVVDNHRTRKSAAKGCLVLRQAYKHHLNHTRQLTQPRPMN